MSASLKYEVLDIIRDNGPLTVRDVHQLLNQQRAISLNAVATVMNRLVEQEILLRQGQARHYLYHFNPSETVIQDRAVRTVKALLSEAGEAGLVHFVGAVDRIQPESIQKLESLLALRREENQRAVQEEKHSHEN